MMVFRKINADGFFDSLRMSPGEILGITGWEPAFMVVVGDGNFQKFAHQLGITKDRYCEVGIWHGVYFLRYEEDAVMLKLMAE